MKSIIIGCAALALVVSASTAEAKGCLKGAAVGGIAGHMAGHHGGLGAAAGCAIGHHQANKNAQTTNGQGNANTGSIGK